MNIFEDAVKRLQKMAKGANIDEQVINALSHAEYTAESSLPVRMDDGSTQYYPAWRCRYNDVLGPTKGGIRFHPAVNGDDVKALALWMTVKCALMNLPYGGGKGGASVDTTKFSRLELERLSRAYVRAMADVIGPEIDIPAPDMYTDARIMGWMLDEYEIIHRRRCPGVFTGKPVVLGGSLGREEATGRGVFYCVQSLVQKTKLKPCSTFIAVQGFGNVGFHTASLLADAGYKVVAVSDVKSGVFCAEGLSLLQLRELKSITTQKDNSEQLKAFIADNDLDAISNQELLELDVTILIPGAIEGVIHGRNVNNVNASYIVEAANGPVLSEADGVLAEKNVIVVPDVMANAGGVTVSYYEWVQNRTGENWPLATVNQKLQSIMEQVFEEVWNISITEKCSLREAAYRKALRRLQNAIQAHGERNWFNAKN